MDTLGLRDRIEQLGYVEEQDMPALYTLADAYVYPSLYEGFGLPVLEAMQCGCPVVASNASSIPEVAGDAAILVDPCDVGAIADAIHRVLTDVAGSREAGRRRVSPAQAVLVAAMCRNDAQRHPGRTRVRPPVSGGCP